VEQPSKPPAERSIFLPYGRIGRAVYAVRLGLVWAAIALLGFVQRAVESRSFDMLTPYVTYLLFAFMVITSVKRLHDMGFSGWTVIILGTLVPLLLFLPGEPGLNTYGSPPPNLFHKKT
jgi:uncharacterized membrane protein YhaH (DUF805 family)